MLTNLKTLINQGIFFSKNFVYKGPEGREPPKVEAAESKKEKNNEGETEKELTTKLEEKQVVKDKLVALLTKYPNRTVNSILKGTTDKAILDYFNENGTKEQKEAVKDNKTFEEITYILSSINDLNSRSSSSEERQKAWNTLNYYAKNSAKQDVLQVLIDNLNKSNIADLSSFESLLAENISCPPDTLKALSNSPFYRTRYLVARNVATPQNVLFKLVSDEYAVVAGAVALNRNTNPVTLHELALKGKDLNSKEIIDSLRSNSYLSPSIKVNGSDAEVLDFFINHHNVLRPHTNN
ncbi:hypothetical protein KBC97_02645 [Candidatus Gracilibacteria bacterium]|nr:hypothetical protein [Candidatus Gracilibacteria bacterium]